MNITGVTRLILVITTALIAAVTTSTGVAQAKPDDPDKIVGGEPAGSPSWTVAFVYRGDGPVEERIACTGSLIGRNYALTAAHCPLSKRQIDVVIGRGDLNSQAGTVRKIGKLIRHPRYRPNARPPQPYDAMVVKLRRPVSQSPLTVAGRSVSSSWGKRSLVSAYGYGRTTRQDPAGSAQLLRAQVRIRDFMRNRWGMNLHGRGKNSCNGDSGGPVIANTSRGTRLVGVIITTTNGCAPGYPFGATRVGWRTSAQKSPIYTWVRPYLGR